MSFSKNRSTKRMQWHTGTGRFARAPSLEGQGIVKVCAKCGQLIPRPEMKVDEATGFIDPKIPWPTTCPSCSEPLP